MSTLQNRVESLVKPLELMNHLEVSINPTAYGEYTLEIRDSRFNDSLVYRKNTFEPNWWVGVEREVNNLLLTTT